MGNLPLNQDCRIGQQNVGFSYIMQVLPILLGATAGLIQLVFALQVLGVFSD